MLFKFRKSSIVLKIIFKHIGAENRRAKEVVASEEFESLICTSPSAFTNKIIPVFFSKLIIGF